MYPRRPKAEAFSNAVDVLQRLHDPSTERAAPPRLAHVQLDDVPQTLDRVEAEGEFRQHDGDDEVTGARLRLSTTTI